MNLRAILSSLILMLGMLSNGMAQGKYGASPEDSVKCVQGLSVYVDFMNQKDYAGAKKYWLGPFNICPKSSLKMYVDGVKMYKKFIDEATDDAVKQGLIDTLLLVHDRRIEHFGKEGYVLGRKGYYMYKYKRDIQEAFNTMQRSVELQGKKSEAATLIYYFFAAVKLEKAGKMETEKVVELFSACMDIIDYNIKNTEKEKVKSAYAKAQENIESKASPYLSCEVIQGLAEKNFEANKDNADWLSKMADLLDKKKCTESAEFFKVANRLHELQPSDESANKMGVLALTKGKTSEAEGFFKQAIELIGDNDNDKKASYEFNLAKTYFAKKQYAAARTHCYNAAKLRPGWGEPYILIGDMYAQSLDLCEGKDKDLKAVYWVAIDKFILAKNKDASVTAEANKKIATYSQYFPKKEDAFFHGATDGASYTVECWINETTTVRIK